MAYIQQLLAKPFPQEESLWSTVKIAGGISIFVAFFLYLFEPFGLHTLESNKLLICLGFGLASFCASVSYEVLMVKGLKFKGEFANFTFGRWVLYLIGVMVCISLANFLFIRLVYFGDIHWALYPKMLMSTFAIGLFPILFLGGLAVLRLERKYQIVAAEFIRKKPDELESKGILFGIPVEQVRYIEAMQNYIKIGHITREGEFKEQTERATLKGFSDEIQSDKILRCHRSYMINTQSINSASGNSQGLQLVLDGCEKQIPVSRSYVPAFRES